MCAAQACAGLVGTCEWAQKPRSHATTSHCCFPALRPRCVVTESHYTKGEDFKVADAVFDCIGEAGDERFSLNDLTTPGLLVRTLLPLSGGPARLLHWLTLPAHHLFLVLQCNMQCRAAVQCSASALIGA